MHRTASINRVGLRRSASPSRSSHFRFWHESNRRHSRSGSGQGAHRSGSRPAFTTSLAEIIANGLPVLLDSGAFSEVRIRNGELVLKHEISDANKIRALLGASRPVTQKELTYSEDLMSHWAGEIDLREWGGDVHDMTELLFQPSSWLTSHEIERLARSLTWLSEEQRDSFVRDPDSFVNSAENESEWLYESLMQAYSSQLRRRC